MLLGEINYQLGLDYNNTDELEAEQEMKISMLKRLLQERNISQSALAKMIGISRQRINNCLSGKHIVLPDFWSRVQNALNLPSDYFSQYRSSLNQQEVQEITEPEPVIDTEKLRNDLVKIKRENNLSNQAISKASGVPLVTVSKLLSGKTKTVRKSTYYALVKYSEKAFSEKLDPVLNTEKLRNDLDRIKKENNLSNLDVAKASGLPFNTVARLLLGKTKKVKSNTYNALVKYIKRLESEEK